MVATPSWATKYSQCISSSTATNTNKKKSPSSDDGDLLCSVRVPSSFGGTFHPGGRFALTFGFVVLQERY